MKRLLYKKIIVAIIINNLIMATVIGLIFFSFYYERIQNPPVVAFKPAIYLYPNETTQINVSLSLNGKIIESDPVYNNGWSVIATPDGKLNETFNYLFYEASLNYLEIPTDGWCIQNSSLETWLESNLIQFGLNYNESQEFF